MLRKILCNYEFTYYGITYKGTDLYLGDTVNYRVAKHKDYASQVVSLVLRRSKEELSKITKSKYWDITQVKLELAGFMFRKLEIHFYPKI